MGVAVVTPFLPDGSVDYPSLEALVESQIGGGADFLCVLGTTAETPCLSTDEKRQIAACVRRVARGRLPLLLGAGGNCTRSVIEGLRSTDLDGYQGVLIVAPYYNKPTQEGLYRHFTAVAEASPLPVVLYNVPGRTGVNLEAATTLRIASEHENVVAIKEASGNLAQIQAILAAAPEGFEVLSGDDAITLDLLNLGATGVISVVGNACPDTFSTLVHAARAGQADEARRLQRRFEPLYPLMIADGNPAGVKCLLALQGKIAEVLRLPLVPATAHTRQALQQALAAF